MASSWGAACGLLLPPPLSPSRRSPAAAAFFPGRSGVPSRPLAPIGRHPAAEWQVRAKRVMRKFVGMRVREKHLARMINEMVQEAMEERAEEEGSVDEVEEVSQAKSDLRRRPAGGGRDPLEQFCEENPDSDECRVYEH